MVTKEDLDTVIRRLFALKAPKVHSLVFSPTDHPIVQ